MHVGALFEVRTDADVTKGAGALATIVVGPAGRLVKAAGVARTEIAAAVEQQQKTDAELAAEAQAPILEGCRVPRKPVSCPCSLFEDSSACAPRSERESERPCVSGAR